MDTIIDYQLWVAISLLLHLDKYTLPFKKLFFCECIWILLQTLFLPLSFKDNFHYHPKSMDYLWTRVTHKTIVRMISLLTISHI